MKIPRVASIRKRPQRREQGSVLIVGMLLLLMMTLLGLMTTTGTRTDARITANNLDRAIAFQAAEAALRDAEARLQTPNPAETLSTDNGFYPSTADAPDYSSWDTTNSYQYRGNIPGIAEQPRYIITRLDESEMLSAYVVVGEVYFSREHNLYHVTVLSTGRSGQTRVVLRTTFVPPEA